MNRLLILLLAAIPFSVYGETLTVNDGREIEGDIMSASAEVVTFRRKSDRQIFKFNLSLLSIKSRKMVQEYHATSRYNITKLSPPFDPKTMRQVTSKIDYLVETRLRELRLGKTSKIDDYTFIRRAYLTIIGRIPTATEIEKYTSSSFSSRSVLIDSLLSHPGFVSHQLNWMSDLLRIQDRPANTNTNIGGIYRQWVREALEENMPYDQLARALIASSGEVLSGSPEVSYYLRDRGMQEDNLSHTVRVFMGTRLQCAMCHDHPFDRWTQREFYEMTAFTSGIGNVTIKEQNKKIGQLSKLIRTEAGPNAGRFTNFRNQVRDGISFGIDNNGTGKIKLPRDFASETGEPGDIVYANAILAPQAKLSSENSSGSRTVFSEWITDPVNPRFSLVIANRLWKRVFGIGVIEPVDTLTDDTAASNEPLITFLEKLMVSVDYDTKEYMRVLLNTDLFSRASVKSDPGPPESFSFSGVPLRRMTGEQVWDSLVVLVYNDIDDQSRNPGDLSSRLMTLNQRYKDMSAEEILNDFKAIAGQGTTRNIYDYIVTDTDKKKKLPDGKLVRSSYLKYPESGGHLIRQFGGSDKEQIENSNYEPNTTQVLSLLNGFVERNILGNKNADFIVSMKNEKNVNKQIESVFISTLGREPTIKETSQLKTMITKPDGWKHVAWIMLNSHEFMFIK